MPYDPTCPKCTKLFCKGNCDAIEKMTKPMTDPSTWKYDASKKAPQPQPKPTPTAPSKPSTQPSAETLRHQGLASGPQSGVPTISYQGSQRSSASYMPGSGYQSGSGSIDHGSGSAGSGEVASQKIKELQLRAAAGGITEAGGPGRIVGPATPATAGSRTPSGSKGQQAQSKKSDSRSGGQGGSKEGHRKWWVEEVISGTMRSL